MYEHDYLGLQDVNAAREWLNALIATGYKFPEVLAEPSTTSIEVQPTVEGQPYRSLPHFNVDRDGKTFADSGKADLQDWMSNVDWKSRPQSAVVKLILMTMDEWPLLKSWVMVSNFIVL